MCHCINNPCSTYIGTPMHSAETGIPLKAYPQQQRIVHNDLCWCPVITCKQHSYCTKPYIKESWLNLSRFWCQFSNEFQLFVRQQYFGVQEAWFHVSAAWASGTDANSRQSTNAPKSMKIWLNLFFNGKINKYNPSIQWRPNVKFQIIILFTKALKNFPPLKAQIATYLGIRRLFRYTHIDTITQTHNNNFVKTHIKHTLHTQALKMYIWRYIRTNMKKVAFSKIN